MSRVCECDICHRRILDLGKPWNMAGWTEATSRDEDGNPTTIHVCPRHRAWVFVKGSHPQEVARCPFRRPSSATPWMS